MKGPGCFIFLLVTLACIDFSLAQCPGTYANRNVTEAAVISIQGANGITQQHLDYAIAEWSRCSGIPDFSSSSGFIDVQVSLDTGSSYVTHLGQVISYVNSSGQLESADIIIYANTNLGDPDGDGQNNYHTLTNDEIGGAIAHELGHVLGLLDASMTCDSIMSPAIATITGPYISNVSDSDCTVADQLWINSNTESPCPTPKRPCPSHSPILIDLGRDGFHLGGPENPVAFDLYGDGDPVMIQWVAPNENEAFLVWDTNNNGIVDGGSELFGQGSILLEKGDRAANGFLALAQHDRIFLGGNDDGYITAEDLLWDELFLWLDSNADGQSQQHELTPILETPLTKLEIDPKAMSRKDRYGNHLKLKAWSFAEHPQHRFRMIDVFFLEVTQP